MGSNILILSHEYPPYAFGGVATFAKELAEYLHQQGHKVYVVAGRTEKGVIVEKHGPTIIRASFPDIPIRSLWYSIFASQMIQKIAHKVDTIIINNTIEGISGHLKNKKIIFIVHGTIEALLSYWRYAVLKKDATWSLNPVDYTYYTLYTYLLHQSTKHELENADHIVAVAHHVKHEILNLYKSVPNKKIKVIYTGLNYKKLKSTNYKKIEKRHKLIIAYVGRLYFTKGITYALQAFKILQAEHRKNAEMWVFGDGPMRQWVEKYINKNGLNIKLFGKIHRDTLLSLLPNVDVLLFPSLYEGSPYALMEANAVGVPVVTWSIPWAQEFVADNINGIKASFLNTTDLGEKLIDAISINKLQVVNFAKRWDRDSLWKTFLEIV